MNTLKDLLEIYTNNPCRTLPNVFWKTAIDWPDSELRFNRDSTGEISALFVWKDQRLMAFWCADPDSHPLSPEEIARTPFVLSHADGLPIFSGRKFIHQRAYFRLINQGDIKQYPCPVGFTFKRVDPQHEIDDIVNLIKACYANIQISPQIVHAWLDHPVYDPDLWIWAIHQESETLAGLGIAERDPKVPEASLEWIQVHPANRNRGLGRALISELCRRAMTGVDFITVSGEVSSASNPEQLYRRCGFTGNDVWWLLYNER